MKTLAVLFFVCSLNFVACDIEESPLSTPADYFDRGVIYFNEGSYKQAEGCFDRAVTMTGERTGFVNTGEAYGYLGRTNLKLGEYRAALNNLQKGIDKSGQESDYRLQAQICTWLADVNSQMMEYSTAAEYYRKSMKLSSALNDAVSRAQTEVLLGSTYLAAGRLEEAASALNNGLTVLLTSGRHAEAAEALRGLAEINRRRGKLPEALNTYTQAVAAIGQTDHPLVRAKLHMGMGLVRRVQKNANAAITEFRDAVNILRRKQVNNEYEVLLVFFIGRIYEQNGRLDDAKKYYSEALEIARAIGDKIAENYLSVFMIRCTLQSMNEEQRSQAWGKMRQSYESVARRFQECGHRTGEAFIYTELGSSYLFAGDLPTARKMFTKAIEIDQTTMGEYLDADLHVPYQEELGLGRDHSLWYEKLASILLQLNLRNDAAIMLDMLQMKLYRDAYENLAVTVRHPKLKSDVQECRSRIRLAKTVEIELTDLLSGRHRSIDKKQVNEVQTLLTGLKKDVKDRSERIIRSHPNYDALLRPSALDLQNVLPYLQDGTVVVQFLAAEKELNILAMTRRGLDVRRVPISKDSLLSLVREYQTLLQDPGVYAGVGGESSIGSMTTFAKLSTRLYECFIRPIDSQLDRNLVIVTSEEFKDFPFHAIERQDARGGLKYLIEITSVDYIPTLSSLRYRSVTANQIRSVVAFGNPTGKNWSVDYELRDIRSFFKGARILIGLEASWKSLLDVQADVLQVSTDFSSVQGAFDLGGLVASTGKTLGETEIVSFERLTDSEPVPIIVLSNQKGQGTALSSRHALLLRINGTSDIFLSAWYADRKSAKFFSEYFYSNMANGLAPGDAYRQALLNLIRTREVSHPRSWGQFFHYGVG